MPAQYADTTSAMASDRFRFDAFVLDPADRQLLRGGVPVELNARYLDALALLVREGGRLVSKDRFLEEVWRGVPVTDEALTQCVKTLRRALGDDATRPRFIETVPKHGYRFIAAVDAPVEAAEPAQAARPRVISPVSRADFLTTGIAGTLGGGAAGLIGGIFYGFAGASQAGIGAVSVLLVLMSVTIVVALLGGAGVSFGIATSSFAPSSRGAWTIVGGAVGGLTVGAFVKLLGLDAFNLLLGESPGNVTGAAEGAMLGGVVGLAVWWTARLDFSLRRSIAGAALTGALGGAAIVLLGGRLFGGSLDLLARSLPHSRLRLDPIGAFFGEQGFGRVSQIVTGALEGALFASCIVAAMLIARRRQASL